MLTKKYKIVLEKPIVEDFTEIDPVKAFEKKRKELEAKYKL